jgi:hypothetical protein
MLQLLKKKKKKENKVSIPTSFLPNLLFLLKGNQRRIGIGPTLKELQQILGLSPSYV